jgi:hypothetical protein
MKHEIYLAAMKQTWRITVVINLILPTRTYQHTAAPERGVSAFAKTDSQLYP